VAGRACRLLGRERAVRACICSHWRRWHHPTGPHPSGGSFLASRESSHLVRVSTGGCLLLVRKLADLGALTSGQGASTPHFGADSRRTLQPARGAGGGGVVVAVAGEGRPFECDVRRLCVLDAPAGATCGRDEVSNAAGLGGREEPCSTLHLQSLAADAVKDSLHKKPDDYSTTYYAAPGGWKSGQGPPGGCGTTGGPPRAKCSHAPACGLTPGYCCSVEACYLCTASLSLAACSGGGSCPPALKCSHRAAIETRCITPSQRDVYCCMTSQQPWVFERQRWQWNEAQADAAGWQHAGARGHCSSAAHWTVQQHGTVSRLRAVCAR
jgi:hypothetical protein